MSECFPKPKSSGRRAKIELELFNYATKADLKNATVLIHQNLLKKLI